MIEIRREARPKAARAVVNTMLTTASERLIQFRRIAVLADLGCDSENMVRYAGSLARWYGSELLLVHAGSPSKKDTENKLKSLALRLDLQSIRCKPIACAATIGLLLKELEEYRPELLVLACHGREGLQKWLRGSVAEEVFRQVEWPVLVLGPGSSQEETVLQKQFENILYATDLSHVSVTALHYAAGIAHDHEAQLTALYVEADPGQGYSFDRTMAEVRLRDWLHERIVGLSSALVGAHCVVDFGKPEIKVVEAAAQLHSDVLIIGARGLGAVSGPASHFLGGTAYAVVCSSPCPVLIVPQPH